MAIINLFKSATLEELFVMIDEDNEPNIIEVIGNHLDAFHNRPLNKYFSFPFAILMFFTLDSYLDYACFPLMCYITFFTMWSIFFVFWVSMDFVAFNLEYLFNQRVIDI